LESPGKEYAVIENLVEPGVLERAEIIKGQKEAGMLKR
jgi:hypothetical protein